MLAKRWRGRANRNPPRARNSVAMHATKKPLRVVIDTNVLISALIFKSGAMAAIRHAWQRGKIVPIISRASAEEFMLALRYPKFALEAYEQEAILAEYLPYCETLAEPKSTIKLPKCRDVDDQAFLLLAAACKAGTLITGDKDLLALAGAVSFEIVSPQSFLAGIGETGL